MFQIKEAIEALYKHPDKTVRSQAETWLLQQQNLPISWQVCTVDAHVHLKALGCLPSYFIAPFCLASTFVLFS